MTEICKLWNARTLLGEGPVWDSRYGKLWFVDIKVPTIHCFDPRSKSMASWPAPTQIGWILPAGSNNFVVGLQKGLAAFDPKTGDFADLQDMELDRPVNRLNDATIGPNGIIWFGSMDDAQKSATGRVYRYDGAHVTATSIDAVTITNGPAISPNGRILYHVDTQGRVIYEVPIGGRGETGEMREFVRFAEGEGNPDGVTTDAEGNVWVGMWGGWCVRCFAPDGRLLHVVRFPTANITKIAFGDDDLKTAYVTTARLDLSADELAAQPDAGALFSFRTDVAGQSLPVFQHAPPRA